MHYTSLWWPTEIDLIPKESQTVQFNYNSWLALDIPLKTMLWDAIHIYIKNTQSILIIWPLSFFFFAKHEPIGKLPQPAFSPRKQRMIQMIPSLSEGPSMSISHPNQLKR